MAPPSSGSTIPDHFTNTSKLASRFITHLFACPEFPQKLISTFDDAKWPSLTSFIAYALHRTRLHSSVTFAALALLQRLKLRFPAARGSSGHRLFISAFMISSKVCCDDTYSNKSWAIVSQGMFSLREMNQMEREMCSYLEWELTIEPEYLSRFKDALERDFGERACSLDPTFGRRASKPAAKLGHSHACGCSHPIPSNPLSNVLWFKRTRYKSGDVEHQCPYCNRLDTSDDDAPDWGLVDGPVARAISSSKVDRGLCPHQAQHPLSIKHITEKGILGRELPTVIWRDKPLTLCSPPNSSPDRPILDPKVDSTADTFHSGAQQQCVPPGADPSMISDVDTVYVPDPVVPVPNPPPPPPQLPSSPTSVSSRGFLATYTVLWRAVVAIPLFLYHTLLLHLPAAFYHRVLHISPQWEDIELSLSECHSRAIRCSSMLQREWKYETLVDIALIPAILTMFQVPFIVKDVITYHLALTCLSFAFMSLLFNTIFHFHSSHCQYLVYTILSAQDIGRPFERTWWDHYVLLSIPTVWFAWTIMFALASIVSIIWHPLDPAGSNLVNRAVAATIPKVPFFGLRLTVTLVFVVGLICLVLTAKTLRAVSQLSSPVRMDHVSSNGRPAGADQ